MTLSALNCATLIHSTLCLAQLWYFDTFATLLHYSMNHRLFTMIILCQPAATLATLHYIVLLHWPLCYIATSCIIQHCYTCHCATLLCNNCHYVFLHQHHALHIISTKVFKICWSKKIFQHSRSTLYYLCFIIAAWEISSLGSSRP